MYMPINLFIRQRTFNLNHFTSMLTVHVIYTRKFIYGGIISQGPLATNPIFPTMTLLKT